MKNLNRIIKPIIISVLCVLMLTSCAKNTSKIDNGKIKVAVSIVPQASFVQAVCGDLVEVVTMIPSGASPETYEPTPLSIENFAKADVYFAVGVPTEENNI